MKRRFIRLLENIGLVKKSTGEIIFYSHDNLKRVMLENDISYRFKDDKIILQKNNLIAEFKYTVVKSHFGSKYDNIYVNLY